MTKEKLRLIWKERVKEYQDSGLTMSEWCKNTGNKLHQLQYWIKKYRNQDEVKSKPTKWVPVKIDSTTEHSISQDVIRVKIGKCEIEVKSEVDINSLKKVISVVNELC